MENSKEIFSVGRTGCGKTTFIQNLGKNRMFGNDIIEVFWVSKLFLNKDREDSIRDSFQDQKVHFSYPQDAHDFNYLIENFMQVKADILIMIWESCLLLIDLSF